MKNIIFIDFRNFTDPQIKEFCDKHNFRYEVVIDNKYKCGVCKSYFICGVGLIAYTLISNPDKIIYSDSMNGILNSVIEYKEEVKPLSDVNAILEKITKCGVDSLLKEEIAILDEIK